MKYGTLNYVVSSEGTLMLNKFERKDDPNSGYDALPGGKLEPYEKGLFYPKGRLESAIRETEAETGITMINPVLRGTILFDNKDRRFQNWKNPDNYYVYFYYATQHKGELKESDEGIPFWAKSWEEINSLPKNLGDALMYSWLRDLNFTPLDKCFAGVIKHNGNELDKENSWVEWF